MGLVYVSLTLTLLMPIRTTLRRLDSGCRSARAYQRPRRRGNGPEYSHGLARATRSLGSASENFIPGTKLLFRPTRTIHRLCSPDTQYRQITSRGFGGILSTSTSTSGAFALAEGCCSSGALTGFWVVPLGLNPVLRGSLTAAYFPFRLTFAGKSVLISTSISPFLLAQLYSAFAPFVLLLYFPELLM